MPLLISHLLRIHRINSAYFGVEKRVWLCSPSLYKTTVERLFLLISLGWKIDRAHITKYQWRSLRSDSNLHFRFTDIFISPWITFMCHEFRSFHVYKPRVKQCQFPVRFQHRLAHANHKYHNAPFPQSETDSYVAKK